MRVEQIGDCTLYLGDCREILPTLGKVDAVVTDPPYRIEFRSNYRTVRSKFNPIANDKTNDTLLWACSIAAGHSKYVFCRWDNLPDVPRPRSCVTWVKNNWSMGNLKGEHGRQTEMALFYAGPDHSFPTGRPSDVIQVRRTRNEWHPTEKPVDLMWHVVRWTAGTVIDPFLGSGTTGVACIKLGRKFIGIEVDEGYFNIACKRICDAYAQPELFVAPTEPQPQQIQLLLGA